MSNYNAGAPREGELELINKYSRRELQAGDVYTFSVVLCDNEIDRDFEYFSTDTLKKLAQLYVGKTGIFNHEPSAKNQLARVISTQVEEIPGRVTANGEIYNRLVARAYIPRTETTKDTIELIDTGILKEVSVGVSINSSRCSICGEPFNMCAHIKGKQYNGKTCAVELTEPLDAYEFSFVAVPAQKEAGVIKARFTIAKHDEEKRIAFGWAYQCKDKNGAQMIDHSGEFVEPETLEKAVYRFVELYREGSDNHERGGIGVLVESMMFTPEKTEALGIPQGTLPTGWWVGFKVNDEDVWAKIKDGTYTMFSIEGRAESVPVD